MVAFVFLGSKGGSGRTASSVMLATGLARIGLRPVHLQLTQLGCAPVIALARGVPFATESLCQGQATPARLLRIIAAHSECSIAVIDMPRATTEQLPLPRFSAAAIFPMKRAAHEISTAVQDYRDFESFLKSKSSRDQDSTDRNCSPWLLPVSWPTSFSDRDLAVTISRFDHANGSGTRSPSILTPGVPEIPRNDLDELINGFDFQCSELINNVAATFARTALAKIKGRNGSV